LSRLPGVRRVSDDGGGLSVELDGATRPVVVAALVDAGIGVETVTSRRRLEDAFIALLEESPDGASPRAGSAGGPQLTGTEGGRVP
ncbi:MAG: hypothetical protein J2P59_08335, partial [Acidimicrobiales bacterium]|nr:hypothetical protein [Acidimicrobiales bacterium]